MYNDEKLSKMLEKNNAVNCLNDFIRRYLPLTPEEHKNWEMITKEFFKRLRAGEVSKQTMKVLGYKRCRICGKVKPQTSFYGNLAMCIGCYNKKRRVIRNASI